MSAHIKALFSLIRNDLKNAANPHLKIPSTSGGDFFFLLTFFPFIELLGTLWLNPVAENKKYYTKAHVKEAVKFMKRYLGKVRKEYRRFGALVYCLYRHPLTHKCSPAVMSLTTKEKISWEISKSYKHKGFHLTVRTETRKENKKNIIYKMLRLDITQFYHDLLKSIDEFEKDALKTNKIRRNILCAEKKLNNQTPQNSYSNKYIKAEFAKEIKNI